MSKWHNNKKKHEKMYKDSSLSEEENDVVGKGKEKIESEIGCCLKEKVQSRVNWGSANMCTYIPVHI